MSCALENLPAEILVQTFLYLDEPNSLSFTNKNLYSIGNAVTVQAECLLRQYGLSLCLSKKAISKYTYGWADALLILVDKGATIRIDNDYPILWSVQRQTPRLTASLLSKIPHTQMVSLHTGPLLYASCLDYLDQVEILLKFTNPSIYVRTSALREALRNGSILVVKLLLQEPNLLRIYPRDIQTAARYGWFDIVQLLLEHCEKENDLNPLSGFFSKMCEKQYVLVNPSKKFQKTS